MIRGITTFKCTQCGEKFKAMDIEFCATAFSQPARCPKCGSYRTRPSSFFDIFGWGDDSSYEEIWKMMVSTGGQTPCAHDYGYYLDDAERIWYGYVYTPIDAQGAIPVLAVKDYEFRSVFEEKDFEHPPLKHISPIGNINCNEGWYYFKLQNEEELEVAKLELQELLKKDDE